MLQSLDKALRGWVTKAIVTLICLSFVLWGVQVWFERGGQTVISKVGKYKISAQELTSRLQNLQREFGDSRFSQGRSLVEVAFNELVQEKFLRTLLDQTRSWLPATVLPMLKTLPNHDYDTLFASLNQLPVNQHQIAELASMAHLKHMLQDSAFNLPKESARLIKSLNQKRDLVFIQLSAQDLIGTQQVSEQAIQDYYKTHQVELLLPAEIKLKKLVINRAFWQAQLVCNKNLRAEYETELKRVQQNYVQAQGDATFLENAKHLGAIVAQAEANAIKKLAIRISRELKYNAAAYQTIAESYGLQWQDLPTLKENELRGNNNQGDNQVDNSQPASFNLQLFFKAAQNGGWVVTTPITWSTGQSLVSKNDLTGGGVVILWPVERHLNRLASLAQATQRIKHQLAIQQAIVQVKHLAQQLAEQWRHGTLSEASIKAHNLKMQHIKAASLADSARPEIEIAFQKCSLVNQASRVAWRCDGERCLVVRLEQIRSPQSETSDVDQEIATSSQRDLEKQALSVKLDKQQGVKLWINDTYFKRFMK